jgi:hypothetical protein
MLPRRLNHRPLTGAISTLSVREEFDRAGLKAVARLAALPRQGSDPANGRAVDPHRHASFANRVTIAPDRRVRPSL